MNICDNFSREIKIKEILYECLSIKFFILEVVNESYEF